MAQNVTINGTTYNAVPAVQIPKSGGGTATFTDVSDTTAVAADVNSGKYIYLANGSKVQGSQNVYSITGNYTQVTSKNSSSRILGGTSYVSELKPTEGYLITSITVTMGGIDITDTVFIGDTASGGGGITPTGTINITQNGTVDVTNYASANVAVPASAVDTGTKSITSNGNNQDVIGYAAVNVNVPNTYSASDEGKVVSNGALVAQGSDTVTQNGTVNTTLINSLTVNVPTGGSQAILGYTQMKTGTITFPARYNSTGNRLIVSLADIGFTPTCFMLKATDTTAEEIRDAMSAGTETAGMVLWAMYCRYPNGTSGNYYHHREQVRINYNSGSPTMSGGQVWTAWTTQTNNYLYNNGTNVYYRTASNYGLPSKEYKWVALA